MDTQQGGTSRSDILFDQLTKEMEINCGRPSAADNGIDKNTDTHNCNGNNERSIPKLKFEGLKFENNLETSIADSHSNCNRPPIQEQLQAIPATLVQKDYEQKPEFNANQFVRPPFGNVDTSFNMNQTTLNCNYDYNYSNNKSNYEYGNPKSIMSANNEEFEVSTFDNGSCNSNLKFADCDLRLSDINVNHDTSVHVDSTNSIPNAYANSIQETTTEEANSDGINRSENFSNITINSTNINSSTVIPTLYTNHNYNYNYSSLANDATVCDVNKTVDASSTFQMQHITKQIPHHNYQANGVSRSNSNVNQNESAPRMLHFSQNGCNVVPQTTANSTVNSTVPSMSQFTTSQVNIKHGVNKHNTNDGYHMHMHVHEQHLAHETHSNSQFVSGKESTRCAGYNLIRGFGNRKTVATTSSSPNLNGTQCMDVSQNPCIGGTNISPQYFDKFNPYTV